MLMANSLRSIMALWLFGLIFSNAQEAPDELQSNLILPSFSRPGGFYDNPFHLVLSAAPLKSSVIFTSDGTLPTLKNGQRGQTGRPVSLVINETTIIQAVTLDGAGNISRPVTQTYLFPESILEQKRPDDLPESLDMDMDPELLKFDDVGKQVLKSFRRIPSVSLVLTHENLFGPQGIYLNPKESGKAWERPCSFEWISPKGKNRQVNCGVEIQGASSRHFSSKHGFQLKFKSQYGAKKFKAGIFPGSKVKKFDSLVLRNPTHDSWVVASPQLRKNARYVNDAWAAETQRLMGQFSPQHRWVHLFLNGFYWGIYAITERPDEHFASSYWGGGDHQYDVFNANRLRSGSRDQRTRLTQLIGHQEIHTPEIYREVKKLLDVEAFIDYVLLNLYANNIDWIDKNYWFIGKKSEKPQFQFVNWDAEILFWEKWESLKNLEERTALDYNILRDQKIPADTQAVGFFLTRLSKNDDFRRLFGDRAHFHLKKGGILSSENAGDRYRSLLNDVEHLLDAEAVRWGDAYEKEALGMDTLEWEHLTSAQGWLFREFFPKRSEKLKEQLKEGRLYPTLEAPILAFEEALEGRLSFTAKNPNQKGEIFFSRMGQDPANPDVPEGIERFDGKLVTILRPTKIWARVLLDSEWSPLETLEVQ